MQAPVANGTPPAWPPRRVILATLAVVAVVAVFYMLWRFVSILFIVYIAAVLGTALRPAVAWLKRRGIPERLGIVVMYLLLLGAVAGVLGLLVPLVVEQGSTLVQALPDYYASFHEGLLRSSSLLIRNLGRNLPATFELSLSASTTQEVDNATLLAQGITALRATSWGLFSTLGVVLITFFWVLDRETIVRSSLLLLPLDRRPQAVELWANIEQKVGGYVRGTAVLCVIIGVLSGVAFFVIGVPSALVLAVLAGVLEAIPDIGPFLTAFVAIAVTLAQAPDKLVYVIAACVVIQQIENAILVPRVMDKAVGVNALVTLLAIAAFGSLLGVLGAIMAIPLAAVLQVLLDYWVLHREAGYTIVGRDKVAALRYQAQDLAQDLRERIRATGKEEDDVFEERIEGVVGDLDEILARLAPAEAQSTGVRA